MGYYSHFEIISSDIADVEDVLNEFFGESAAPHFESDGRSYDSTKWYGWIEDLQKVANLHPNSYLVMERTGEESPDISRAVMKNGKVIEIQPEIVWPEH